MDEIHYQQHGEKLTACDSDIGVATSDLAQVTCGACLRELGDAGLLPTKPTIVRTLTLEARDYFGETGDDTVVTKLNLMSDHSIRWESTNLGGW